MERNSKILLVKNIKMDKNYKNVLNYQENEMVSLCIANKISERDDYSFIRPTNDIITGFSYSDCLQANYIAFQNPDYSNKWFFAWIDEVEYISKGSTKLKYTIDAWSTWYSYWTEKKCYTLRHHVNDDVIGRYTIDENLNVGDVEEESYNEFLSYGPDGNNYYFCINTTYNPFLERDFDGAVKINGNLAGNYIYCFDVYEGQTGTPNVANFIYKTASDNKIEAIQDVYILPKDLIDNIGTRTRTHSSTFGSFTAKELNGSDEALQIACPFYKTKTFSDYTPKNKKCFCYPYNYLLLSNNVGNQNIYKYEDFEDVDVNQFEMQMAVSVGGSIRLVPKGHKNMEYDYDESIPLAKFPTCSWSTDSFINWLTANAVNIGTQIVGLGVSAATGNIATASTQIAGLIGQFREAILKPNITGGNNTGDVNFAVRKNTFVLHHMRAKTEYLRQIDDYFTKYGYKINRIIKPNLTGRSIYNYIEIASGESIGFSESEYGSVPSNFMDIINSACQNGVTIWHNHSNIGNYDLNNNII